ncbi:hypothetical protein BJV74DRAFT_793929 [Russula compacta]|nr:hypothetical protein BJV74DRAFT_793929 [Russula compacta]
MNIQPGGKQHRMHDTFIPNDNPNPSLHGILQMMVFPEDLSPTHPDYKFHGQPKGMLHVLEECGLLTILKDANNGKGVEECTVCKMLHKALDEPLEEAGDVVLDTKCTDCCMRKMIDNQQDFKSEKPLIQLICKEAGHECWFLPKFHWFHVSVDGTFHTKFLMTAPSRWSMVFSIKAGDTWMLTDRKGLNTKQAEQYGMQAINSNNRHLKFTFGTSCNFVHQGPGQHRENPRKILKCFALGFSRDHAGMGILRFSEVPHVSLDYHHANAHHGKKGEWQEDICNSKFATPLLTMMTTERTLAYFE